MTTIPLPDIAATQALATRIAAKLRPGDVLALEGTLGVGKTTLARELLRALGYAGDVPSPSFTIIETYDPPQVHLPVVHADFYRLEHPAEAEEIGLDDYRHGAVLIAEWPDHAGGFGHEPDCLTLRLEIAENGRQAIVLAGKGWLERLP
ncbi:MULTISPECIES: tRNA (adenosine(37)-N6)-threonylcarbamoyltransferase complex ATPase subunit type 1 TsaE [unclassified Novosphingobium]|uniref:tRNA (adenosine(37)-N6)-threonylcarbamoyltransferase complex ATPase subunit type 1 TsaE n=1 Tax=unclassified Novosphingobium TaxID=2644732 RepID=UPI0006B9A4DC|nr:MULTISPECIES: tRNA (adenosine(37)-N6)-threonylcarbamoyltransferase complex ATPase subunit type 1 TsaE [unclassified Novosphingobium]KPF55427.1 tRNA threonylcarbamoyladenosine biosynthesis protein TsaE [Novosphingobium sp. AAP1]PTR08261.1 tRNA threonylcarbamoyladenosine biosynthesis protein TsaE [Novosphingobium sp. GV055]PUB01015.1 tRNA threonylcarbamoyladenosine biosynthesis protein TsaE [Novosphingobium sp. GV061]PUB16548.1 tRNA threonylcarbamoyladenosine biosynthesis protein TsaE [Novosph